MKHAHHLEADTNRFVQLAAKQFSTTVALVLAVIDRMDQRGDLAAVDLAVDEGILAAKALVLFLRFHWDVYPTIHAGDRIEYPHQGGCPQCRSAYVCNACGKPLGGDASRCTNGRCGNCHRAHCIVIGDTVHGYGTVGR